MPPRTALLVLITILTLEFHRISSYKTLEQLKQRYNDVENKKFTTSDVLVGKAMDFVYSNKTLMSLIANELWGIGSKTIDAIVEMDSQELPRVVWYPKKMVDMWAGKRTLVGLMTSDFIGVLNGLAVRPKYEWRPQSKHNPDRVEENPPEPNVRVIDTDAYNVNYEYDDYSEYPPEKTEKELDDELERYIY